MMATTNPIPDEHDVNVLFDHAERHERGIAALAARAELACATAEVCSAYLAAFVCFNEAVARGEVANDAVKVQLLTVQADVFRAFFAAWHRGASTPDNLRVVEVAVHSFVQTFGCTDDIRVKAERWLLDAVVGPMRRLPVLPAVQSADGEPSRNWTGPTLAHPGMGDVGTRLASLMDALQGDGGDMQGDATRGAVEAVRDSIGAALGRGVEPERMQIALDHWHAATGGPRIVVHIGDQPGT